MIRSLLSTTVLVNPLIFWDITNEFWNICDNARWPYSIQLPWDTCSYPFSLQGVDLNPRDREKCTPLLLAAAHGCSAVVSLLLESGADVTCEDEKKRTALHWAVGQDRTIERLLKVKLNTCKNVFLDKPFTYANYICWCIRCNMASFS